MFTTGTYSARLNYRILYKTNYSGTYQVLVSNLITSSSYSFSLNAIPTQAGEYVTDIYLDFGKVPVGFQSTSNPALTVQVLGYYRQRLSDHQPGRCGRQIPGNLADRSGHLAHCRAQTDAHLCSYPSQNRLLSRTEGRSVRSVPLKIKLLIKRALYSSLWNPYRH